VSLGGRELKITNARRMQLAAKLRGNDKDSTTTLQKLIAGIEHL
jgi:hypothetical protein